MKTVIFDLDGTLADIETRRGFIEDKKNWKMFNDPKFIIFDKPNAAVVELFSVLSEFYSLVICSGRMEDAREATIEWLKLHVVCYKESHLLLLREQNDFRNDHIIKKEMLDYLLSQGRRIAFAVDDRQQVVDMWRRNGVTCLQCDVGNF